MSGMEWLRRIPSLSRTVPSVNAFFYRFQVPFRVAFNTDGFRSIDELNGDSGRCTVGPTCLGD